MSDSPLPEDLQHLPTADAAEARAAKSALWKEIAQKKKLARAAAEAAQQQPLETAPQEVPQEEMPQAPVRSSRDEWAELFAMNPEEVEPSSYSAPVLPAATPKKRSIIRRSTPLVVPEVPAELEAAPEPVSEPVLEPLVVQKAPETIPEPPAEVPAAPVKQMEVPKETAAATPPEQSKPDKDSEAHSEATEQGDEDAPTAKNTRPEAGSDKPEVPFLVALLQQKWVQWGGASLSLSLGIHALILGVGGFLVVNQVMLDQAVDFLPGGTQQGQQASQALEHKVNQKKQPWLKKAAPMRKIAAVGSISDIVLPDEVPDLLDLPSSNDMLSSNKLGGAGLGGGGFGKGMGLGSKSGMVFQPLSMFGREIKAKRLALILDVSSSMAPYLPRVIEEVDKVAKGSVVVLFPGCGLDSPPNKGLDGEEVYRTNGAEFERFWRMGGMATLAEARKFKFSRSDPISGESIFTLLSKRPQTHFVHYVGIGYTWTALLSEQVRQADALYWFSDFQDHVDFSQLDIVRENLLRRKQKLYIQPYMHGSSFDLIKNQLVVPTGGEVIEAVLE